MKTIWKFETPFEDKFKLENEFEKRESREWFKKEKRMNSMTTKPTFTKQSDGARICNVCKVQGEFVNCDVCGGDGIAGMDDNDQPSACDACAGDGGKWVCPNCKE